MWLALGAVKKAFASYCKEVDPPPIALCYTWLWHGLAMERLADKIDDSRRSFDYIWDPLVRFLSKGLPIAACSPRLQALHLFHV
ncbi:hypothetical protein NDU88_004721 [Pleurodeles waltl]|uniref:Uncharacterized protein n=1 Tax=Pleurodeles waltl TaxID=8319 RepID=A0AAV7MY18_PLEWA|nr:hypothetical protein NDU88_004721 [Pleurodeles waltl]